MSSRRSCGSTIIVHILLPDEDHHVRAGAPVHGIHSPIRTCAVMRWHVVAQPQVDASEQVDLRCFYCCCIKENLPDVSSSLSETRESNNPTPPSLDDVSPEENSKGTFVRGARAEFATTSTEVHLCATIRCRLPRRSSGLGTHSTSVEHCK